IHTEKKVISNHQVICHYCKVSGHIKPRCFKMLRDQRWKQAVVEPVSTAPSTA
ncbi:hypothetical protein J1N35_028913, partial [Gossypium stocksii]